MVDEFNLIFVTACLAAFLSVFFFMFLRQRGCPLLAKRRLPLLLHAFGTVCHFTSLTNHLYRLYEQDAEAISVKPQFPVTICCHL